VHAVFFVTVWPEPLSSAAGVRTRELVTILLENGWMVTIASPSGAESEHREALRGLGVRTLSLDPNDSAKTDPALRAVGPADLVLFDRFVMEEQFGWRARERWPGALHLVDTQDLHSLRRARERLVSAGAPPERVREPSTEDFGDDLVRELGSLYRADGALVVSSFEADLLEKFGYPFATYLPFSATACTDVPPFADRAGFCFLGNYRHPPNLDAVRALLAGDWPAIRERLPRAELHLYGAYPPAEISAHRGANGVFAQGPVADHRAALARHRALLAPLRFGAGIKGKVLEAWATGTPVAGTPLSFEGMGFEATEAFVDSAVRLASDENAWNKASAAGLAHVQSHFSADRIARDFLASVDRGRRSLGALRERNVTGRLLRHQSQNATKYFSRWIEAKNAKPS
jgi:glycosyltransferase involved in cell wall biosynthesis